MAEVEFMSLTYNAFLLVLQIIFDATNLSLTETRPLQ
jgi:hypothetical protein